MRKKNIENKVVPVTNLNFDLSNQMWKEESKNIDLTAQKEEAFQRRNLVITRV